MTGGIMRGMGKVMREGPEDIGYAQTAKQMMRNPSQRERLMQQKTIIEDQLEKINAALGILDEHPEFERFVDIMGQV